MVQGVWVDRQPSSSTLSNSEDSFDSFESHPKRIKLMAFDHLPQQGGVTPNLSEESSPLGLTLRKTPSLLDLIEAKVFHQKRVPSTTTNQSIDSEEAKCQTNDSAEQREKWKASNFNAMRLQIGTWERVSRRDGDVVAKCYYSKRKLVWEILEGGLKSKLEIQFSDISAIRAVFPQDGHEALEIELKKAPSFFVELNPQPRKHTIWQASSDFTGGQATLNRYLERATLWFCAYNVRAEDIIQGSQLFKYFSIIKEILKVNYYELVETVFHGHVSLVLQLLRSPNSYFSYELPLLKAPRNAKVSYFQTPFWRHFLQFAKGSLWKHYERLLQCDEWLLNLSKRPFPSSTSPYFNFSFGGCLEFSDFEAIRPQSMPTTPHSNQVQTFEPRVGPIASVDLTSPMSVIEFPPVQEHGQNYRTQPQRTSLGKRMEMANQVQESPLCMPINQVGYFLPRHRPSHSSPQNSVLQNIADQLLYDPVPVACSDETKLMARVKSMASLLQLQNEQTPIVNASANYLEYSLEKSPNNLSVSGISSQSSYNDSGMTCQESGFWQPGLGSLVVENPMNYLPRNSSFSYLVSNQSWDYHSGGRSTINEMNR